MSQEPSGEASSAADRMKKVDSVLDQYESKLGLPNRQELQIADEIQEYLSLSRETMGKMNAEECGEVGVRLEQAAFQVQRAYNVEVGHVTWAKEAIRLYIADKSQAYKGSFQQQEAQAIKQDSYASKLHSIQVYAQQRCDRLYFLSSALTRLADRMYQLQMSKNRRVN